jgi:hypothetical protein
VISQDVRGKRDCAFKLVDERAEIKQHKECCPEYFIHYLRYHTEKKYVSSNLSIKKMYDLYAENAK